MVLAIELHCMSLNYFLTNAVVSMISAHQKLIP